MKHIIKFSLFTIACAMVLSGCSKKESPNPGTSTTTTTTTTTITTLDTGGTLKVTTAPYFANMGFAVTYGSMNTNAAFAATVKNEVNIVTFGNELKEGSVVGNNGTYNYSTADALYNLCTTAGLQVYGHTLVWYSQQNATYLNGLIAAAGNPGTGGTPAPNLLAGSNGDFEQGSGNTFTGWTDLAGGASSATFTAVGGNNSTRALQVNVTTPGANAYDVQSIGPNFTVTPGHSINFSIDIKTAVAGGRVRDVVQNNNYLQYDITPTASW